MIGTAVLAIVMVPCAALLLYLMFLFARVYCTEMCKAFKAKNWNAVFWMTVLALMVGIWPWFAPSY